MKPDGVDTAMEAIGAEPQVEGTAEEEEPQQDPLHSHADEAEKQQPEMPAAPPDAQEGNSKTVEAKTKGKGPAQTRPGTSNAKTMTAGPSSRPSVTPSRSVNGVQKPLANGEAKKSSSAAPEKKKPASTTAPAKKPASPTKVPAKGTEKKPVGSGTGGPSAAAPPQPNKKGPVGGAVNGAKAKLKSAPKPMATAASSKPGAPATPKTDKAAVSKATRPASGPPAPRPTSASAAGKLAVNTSTALARNATSRAGATAPPAGRTTAAQPSKSAGLAKKDVSKQTTVPVKKPAAPPTRPSTAKTVKTDAPKPSVTSKLEPAPKRLVPPSKTADAKASRTKPQDGKPVAASPRASAMKPSLSKSATPSPKKPVGSSASTPVRRGSKPVQPLSASGEPTKKEEPQDSAMDMEAAAVAATVTAAAAAVAVIEPQVTAKQELASVTPGEGEEQAEEAVQLPSTGEIEPEVAGPAQEIDQGLAPVPLTAEVPVSPSSADLTEGEIPPDSSSQISSQISVASENLIHELGQREVEVEEVVETVKEEDVLVPKNIGAEEPGNWVAEPESVSEALAGGPKLAPQIQEPEAVEKADEEINDDDDYGGDVEEEEEKEGSQLISLSEMSGTQPTEDSRPGSAGLVGSMWRGGALASELDSEDVSCSQQGASELSAPGMLEGTESMDDLGEASLKGADGEGASAGSPDLETVPDIPANEEDEDDDEDDRVCDMEVGSERAEDSRKARQEDEEEDEDVEMASEGVTESGLESYGNADEDDFAEDDRLDNLNRSQPPPMLSTGPAAHWAPASPFAESCTQPAASALPASPTYSWVTDPETPVQAPTEPWMDLCVPAGPQAPDPAILLQVTQEPQSDDVQQPPVAPAVEGNSMPVDPVVLPLPPRGMSQSSTLSGTELAAQSSSETSTPEELREYNSSSGVESEDKHKTPVPHQPDVEQDPSILLERGDGEEEEAETLPADEVLGGPATAPASALSSPSASGDEVSDTEGEMLIDDPGTLGDQNLPAAEEHEETGQLPYGEGEDGGDTPQSANSIASYGFDCTTSNSNAHSTQSPGIFSLENEDQMLEETKDPTLKELTLPAATADPPLEAPVDLLPFGPLGDGQSNPEEQQYMLCGKLGAELPDLSPAGEAVPPEPGLSLSAQQAGEGSDAQPAYYAICEKTDSVLAGGREPNTWGAQCQQQQPAQLLQRTEHNHMGSLAWRTHSQPPLVPQSQAWQPTDLPSRTPQAQPNQKQQNRERQKPMEAEVKLGQQHKGENEEADEKLWQEQQTKLEKQRQDLLQLQAQQQQQELKHRQQILQWQQELVQQHKSQPAVLLSPTSGLCTIYEAMEATDDEEEGGENKGEENNVKLEERATVENQEGDGMLEWEQGKDSQVHQADPEPPDLVPPQRPMKLSTDDDQLDLDWDKKVDIVQQLISQTLLLAGDGCPPVLLLPGGGGGTLSPLESSMWPNLLPPLTPPSATVTSVSSFSPEDQGNSTQGEWTVVELETHH